VADAKVNILGSLTVLECCKKFKCRKIIFASSVGVYGEPQGLPIKEEHLPKPISPYPITKLTIEKYLAYYENQGLRSTSLRFSNIYGPRQSDKGEGGVITIFINKFIRGDRPMIFGDGNQTRDFLYVDDVVDALVLSTKASSGLIYNVGTGKEVTVKCLFKLLNKNLNKRIKPIFKPLRPGEVIRSKVDSSRIEKDLGWRPKYELVVGLKLAIEWFKKDKKN
jgi:UDP-glucose 4-epimerase